MLVLCLLTTADILFIRILDARILVSKVRPSLTSSNLSGVTVRGESHSECSWATKPNLNFPITLFVNGESRHETQRFYFLYHNQHVGPKTIDPGNFGPEDVDSEDIDSQPVGSQLVLTGASNITPILVSAKCFRAPFCFRPGVDTAYMSVEAKISWTYRLWQNAPHILTQLTKLEIRDVNWLPATFRPNGVLPPLHHHFLNQCWIIQSEEPDINTPDAIGQIWKGALFFPHLEQLCITIMPGEFETIQSRPRLSRRLQKYVWRSQVALQRGGTIWYQEQFQRKRVEVMPQIECRPGATVAESPFEEERSWEEGLGREAEKRIKGYEEKKGLELPVQMMRRREWLVDGSISRN